MTAPVAVNLNSMVSVQLTERGVRALRTAVTKGRVEMNTDLVQDVEGETAWLDADKTVPAWTAPLTIRLELWRAFSLFGSATRSGAPACFVHNELQISPIRGLPNVR